MFLVWSLFPRPFHPFLHPASSSFLHQYAPFSLLWSILFCLLVFFCFFSVSFIYTPSSASIGKKKNNQFLFNIIHPLLYCGLSYFIYSSLFSSCLVYLHSFLGGPPQTQDRGAKNGWRSEFWGATWRQTIHQYRRAPMIQQSRVSSVSRHLIVSSLFHAGKRKQQVASNTGIFINLADSLSTCHLQELHSRQRNQSLATCQFKEPHINSVVQR